MGVAQVEGFQGVGRGLTDLIQLWKSEEKSKAPHVKPTCGGTRRKAAPPLRKQNREDGPTKKRLCGLRVGRPRAVVRAEPEFRVPSHAHLGWKMPGRGRLRTAGA